MGQREKDRRGKETIQGEHPLATEREKYRSRE